MMQIKNTKESYGLVSKIFHWPMAFIILGLILVGLYMGGLPNSPYKFEIYALHKSFGLLVLWLVGLRILWRLFNKQPEANASHKSWERLLAKLAHFLLYIAMIGMPLSGWLMSSAGEYPVPFFGLQMPDLVGKNPDLGAFMHEVHEVLGSVLIGTIFLHALGALKHHFIDKDSTLVLMMAKPMKHIGPYILIAILGLFGLGILALSIFGEEEGHETITEEISSKLEKPSYFSEDNAWKIVKEQSSINFRASVYNKEFTGTFSDFGGKIIFNPDDLKNSHADITINIKTLSSGDAERDSQMFGPEWFDIASFPTAHFRTTAFEKKAEGRYVAIGELTIKNRAMPLILPFQLDIIQGDGDGGARAYMNGSVSLNRLDFGLGEGRWEAADAVGLNVFVDLKIIAISK